MTDFKQGKDAYDKGDYFNAFRILQPLSVRGDLESMLLMASMFEIGRCVPQNYEKANELYYNVSCQDDARAQFKMGEMHYKGFGRTIDYVSARTYFKKAAEQGHAGAQYYLGLLYENGQDVAVSPTEAHVWFNLAASNGYEKAAEARDRVADGINPTQIAVVQRAALDWFFDYFNHHNK